MAQTFTIQNNHETQHRSFSVEENHATKVQTQILRLYTPGQGSLPPGVLFPYAKTPPPLRYRSFQTLQTKFKKKKKNKQKTKRRLPFVGARGSSN